MQTVQSSVHSRLLAWDRGPPIDAAGVVRKNDLLDAFIRDGTADPRALVRPAPIVPDTMDGFDVLDTLKNSPAHMVLVQDQYGELLGIVTTADILEAIVGTFQTDEGPAEPEAKRRNATTDRGWWRAACRPMSSSNSWASPPSAPPISTPPRAWCSPPCAACPRKAMLSMVGGWRFEVLDMDGRRIDKLLATRVTTVHRAVNT